jgi:hypothetical protein
MSPAPVEIEHDIEDKSGGHHHCQPAIEFIDPKDDPRVGVAGNDMESPARDVLPGIGMALSTRSR